MSPFIFNTTKSVVFENGAAQRLSELAGSLLGAVCLLVTDSGLRKLGLVDATVSSLEATGHTVVIFDEVEADPSRETLMKAVETGRAAGVTSVIGFGGGSSQDVAKLAALLLGSDADLDRAWGVGQAKGPRLPLVLIPTTAGTGSEVTPVSIITVGAEEKRGVSSPVILPDMAILDAELTLGLPAHITAATGIDAMVHAIEAYASKNANNNPISKLLAREALRLLGLSNALVLPHVLRFNAPDAGSLYAEIAGDAFPHLAEIAGTQARTAAFIDALADLAKRVGLQTRLRDVDIPKSAIDKMAADAMLQTRLLVNNPREVTQDDARMIYTAAW